MNMETMTHDRRDNVDIYVHDESDTETRLSGARLEIFDAETEKRVDGPKDGCWETGEDGHFRTTLPPGEYRLAAECFNLTGAVPSFVVKHHGVTPVTCSINIDFDVTLKHASPLEDRASAPVKEGDVLLFTLSWPKKIGGKALGTSVVTSKGTVATGYTESSTG